MDDQTALVLALQLVTLLSVAGALLLYLLCKIRSSSGDSVHDTIPGANKPILVTCCDNVIGLQIALHLAEKGYRVFAGLRSVADEAGDCPSLKIIKAWLKSRESSTEIKRGTLVPLPLDVTREDVVREAVDLVRAQLPAGYDGIWAIINSGGLCYRGRLEQQDNAQWDAMFKFNVIGVLRTVRAFLGLLRNTRGRILMIGVEDLCGSGLVAYAATRCATEGASIALRRELEPYGIKTVVVNVRGVAAELMGVPPRINKSKPDEVFVQVDQFVEFQPKVLTSINLQILDVAITATVPKQTYVLSKKNDWLTSKLTYLLRT